MATPIAMPRQGQSVESCVIQEWLKKPGDTVQQGENLFTYETDKASFEFESPVSGTLLEIFFKADADVPVLAHVAVIGEPGENIDEFRAGGDAGATAAPANAPASPESEAAAREQPAQEPATRQKKEPASGESAGSSPRARNLASRSGVDISQAAGTGPRGRVIERDVKSLIADGVAMTSTAAAKAGAEGLVVPASGTGMGGRIRATDLAAEQSRISGAAGQPGDSVEEVVEVKLSNMRKIIGERMAQSLQEAAQLTMHSSADATQLMAFRAEVKQKGEALGLANITITDLVLLAVTRVLPKFPEINALYKDGKLYQYKHVHLALAVDTPRGLMVPVIRYANRLSLNELAVAAKELAVQCNEGSINPDFLSGGTLTVSNLGAFGVEYFTPVLNLPQVALLGVNTIGPKPVMGADGQCGVKPHIGLSLTIDHRAVDGAPGARFLKAVVDALENIQLTLSL